MHRRRFLTVSAAAAGAALTLSALPGIARAEAPTYEYEARIVEAALESGKAVLLDYSARWCGTCAAQKRVIEKLRAEDPGYDARIVFVRVDWDTFKRDEVTTSRNVPRRSTLVLLQGDAELGRVVASTRESDIKALLDLAAPGS